MCAYIRIIFPRQSFSKIRRHFTFFLQILYCYPDPIASYPVSAFSYPQSFPGHSLIPYTKLHAISYNPVLKDSPPAFLYMPVSFLYHFLCLSNSSSHKYKPQVSLQNCSRKALESCLSSIGKLQEIINRNRRLMILTENKCQSPYNHLLLSSDRYP